MANKIFPRNTKKKFEEKNDVSRVTPKSAILTTKKKLEILERSYICLQNVAKQSRY